MGQVDITLSANAGIMLEYRGKKVMVDILHNTEVPVFNSVPEEVSEKIIWERPFSHADVLMISHGHPDHYSRKLVDAYLAQNKDTFVLAPFEAVEQEQRELLLQGLQGRITFRGITIDYYKLIHEGKQYMATPHYGFVVQIEGKTFVFFNDASLKDNDIAAFVGDREVDVAFINFPWMTLPKGRKAIETVVRPKKIVLYHLPYLEKDPFGYNRAAQQGIQKLNIEHLEAYSMNRPLQKVTLDI